MQKVRVRYGRWSVVGWQMKIFVALLTTERAFCVLRSLGTSLVAVIFICHLSRLDKRGRGEWNFPPIKKTSPKVSGKKASRPKLGAKTTCC